MFAVFGMVAQFWTDCENALVLEIEKIFACGTALSKGCKDGTKKERKRKKQIPRTKL